MAKYSNAESLAFASLLLQIATLRALVLNGAVTQDIATEAINAALERSMILDDPDAMYVMEDFADEIESLFDDSEPRTLGEIYDEFMALVTKRGGPEPDAGQR